MAIGHTSLELSGKNRPEIEVLSQVYCDRWAKLPMSNTVSLGETMGHSDYNDKVVAQCIKREAQLNMASD